MSISTRQSNCQEIITKLQELLTPLTKEAAASPVTLNLDQHELAATAALYPATTKAVIVESSVRQLATLHQEVSAWQETTASITWHVLPTTLTPQELNGSITTPTSKAVHHLLAQTPHHHFLIPANLIEELFPAPAAYQNQTIHLASGQTCTPTQVAQQLVTHGYIRFTSAIEPGGFRIRGEQLDIHDPITDQRYTIMWYGSAIEKITHHHKRRTALVPNLALTPLAFPAPDTPLAQLLTHVTVFRPQHLTTLTSSQTVIHDTVSSNQTSLIQTQSDVTSGLPAYVFFTNYDRTHEYLRNHPEITPVSLCRHPLAHEPVNIRTSDFQIVTEEALLPIDTKTAKPVSYEEGLALLAELTVNTPVVHSDHGIGIFEGLVRKKIEENEREYLLIRYAAGDTLLVPVEFAYKVTAYVGDTTPPLHRLGGTIWKKTKKKAERDAVAFAKELLQIANERAAAQTHTFTIDATLEETLEKSFGFTLTPDQAQAWHATQEDLTQSTPMDRLIVGDVGFGKTEIAIRAAAHAAHNGFQIAVLCPTTILVQQHYDTFVSRLPHLTDQIGLLSRFASPAEQKATRQRIHDGSLKIIIGTHALLSKHTHWKNLGLVIIDEEQRFGVSHKEHFKKIRAATHVLSLSATPIPRTLSMALSGIKQLSVITTAPTGRKSVETIVSQYDDKKLASAIAQEQERKGQVYVVAPRIRRLHEIERRIKKLFPAARTAIAHGQMENEQLARIMHEFDIGNVDILVSSTIVENGLDLPNANTLIIFEATRFGLAELYQLRGRVGRRKRQGYAYFFFNQEKMTSVQRQRLTALTESAQLGSGWNIARRDLEIRGAGNLLGAEQSGTVNAVGAQLYLDMVRNHVQEETDHPILAHDVDIQLPLTALIPTHYVADATARTHAYQRLARARTLGQLRELYKNICDQYGTPPTEMANLYRILQLQHIGRAANISQLSHHVISPADEDPYHRLIIKGKELPTILKEVGALGNWVVRNDCVTLDVDAVTPELIDTLIATYTS